MTNFTYKKEQGFLETKVSVNIYKNNDSEKQKSVYSRFSTIQIRGQNR